MESTTQPRTLGAGTSSRAGLVARHPLAAYFALAYGLSWLIMVPAGLALGLGLLPEDARALGLLNNLTVYGPAIAALIVTAVTSGRAGVAQLLRRLVQWRVGAGWYLVVLFGPPLVALGGARRGAAR